jgi:DNA-binding transcriptional ArsR family regulator
MSSVMRPLHHPAVEDISVEGILHALSEPARAHIYAAIAAASHPQTCSVFLEISDRTLPKSTLSQHFKVLRESGLIRSERRGVELQNTSRCDEINQRFPGLMPAITAAYRAQTKAALPQRMRRRPKG